MGTARNKRGGRPHVRDTCPRRRRPGDTRPGDGGARGPGPAPRRANHPSGPFDLLGRHGGPSAPATAALGNGGHDPEINNLFMRRREMAPRTGRIVPKMSTCSL
ncbi:hypothetical protein EVAR_86538_1 [Eumeta japonica]|uniref:Uncharacterized protein n=1 Tax=Eumeta variegata TaxID=151549 RepID=A0A4C1VP06_EUMVA|nr:hypothetical protein EVAR_86538_1 [Eumeta japonica]